MKCPVDHTPLAALEYDDVEVDYCMTCQGIWLDADELDLLFGERQRATGFVAGGQPTGALGENKRRCPICEAAMAKAVTEGARPIVYDRCPRGHGLWFDAGELAAVLEHGHPAPGGEEVAAWLRSLFRE